MEAEDWGVVAGDVDDRTRIAREAPGMARAPRRNEEHQGRGEQERCGPADGQVEEYFRCLGATPGDLSTSPAGMAAQCSSAMSSHTTSARRPQNGDARAAERGETTSSRALIPTAPLPLRRTDAR